MHPSLDSILRGFKYEHLAEGQRRDTAHSCASLAEFMAAMIPSQPELVAGLRKLLEAKDCFVRAVVYAEEDAAKKAETK